MFFNKKEKELTFIDDITATFEEANKELYDLCKKTRLKFKGPKEREFLRSFENKYLVIKRNGRSYYYGRVKQIEGKYSLDIDTLTNKYTLKISYEKDSKISIVYLNPLKKNSYKLFKTEAEALKE